VPGPPKRVVSAGHTAADYLLAVDVVPVAVTNWFGDQPFATWPWAQAKLGAARPVVLSLDNGIQLDQIAGLKPDLIVATDAGVDADTYAKLTAIAPTIPQSGGDAFFEPWQEQATAIGRATFRAGPMKSVIDDVERRFAAAAKPGFAGKKVLLLEGQLERNRVVAVTGWRTKFLTQLGLTLADTGGTVGQRAVIPTDRLEAVLRGADVLIWTTDGDDDKSALLADPQIAAAADRSVFTSGDLGPAITFASPLSYPLVAERLPPLIPA